MEFILVFYLCLVPLVIDASYIRLKSTEHNSQIASNPAPLIKEMTDRNGALHTSYPTKAIEKALKKYKQFLPLLNQSNAIPVRRKRDASSTSMDNGECNSDVYYETPTNVKTMDNKDFIVVNHGPYYQLVVTETCLRDSTRSKICLKDNHLVGKTCYTGSCEQQHQHIYLITYNSNTKAIERSVFQYNSSCVCKLKPKFSC
ncbi:uncharacterized protein LOC126733966 [Anthonomus grandis grandis]|uniref:uncharacterized protein LOC126733966 n=1 Tax=Anthonomus grandis grandis TaxID=2921223 RepID=UPI002165F43A|nr:uncharacterized protein LOC126733966 [Anthonomus grandis grandis]